MYLAVSGNLKLNLSLKTLDKPPCTSPGEAMSSVDRIQQLERAARDKLCTDIKEWAWYIRLDGQVKSHIIPVEHLLPALLSYSRLTGSFTSLHHIFRLEFQAYSWQV